jgi:hypothetical protein
MLIPVFLLGLSCSIHASYQRPYPPRAPYRTAHVAYDLEAAAGSLRHDAEYAFRRSSRHEKRALKEIRRLHDRARDFRRSVERRHGDLRRVQRDFDRLAKQYYRAENALRYAYAPQRIYRSLSHVRRLMGQVQRGYAYYR